MESNAVPAARRVPVFVWVLVGLGGFCLLALIAALLAMPNIGKMTRRANEIAAISSLRTIGQAEIQYDLAYPANGYACSVAILGGDSSSGGPSGQAGQLIDRDLASGIKSGYVFKISNCSQEKVNNLARITEYRLTAVPVVPGKSGDRGFCADSSGTIKFDPKGGTDCSQILDQ